jgi:hypothetical protein
MNKILLVSFIVCSSASLNAQTQKQQISKSQNVSESSQMSFDDFCLKHATQIIVETSKSVKVTGKVLALDPVASNYMDYGVALKEEETQYFMIEGSTNLLKVESLYRLRLMYNSSTK